MCSFFWNFDFEGEILNIEQKMEYLISKFSKLKKKSELAVSYPC